MVIRHRVAVFALAILLYIATFSCTPREVETPGLPEISVETPATTISATPHISTPSFTPEPTHAGSATVTQVPTSGPTPTLGAAICPPPSLEYPTITQPTTLLEDSLALNLEPQIRAYINAAGGEGDLEDALSSLDFRWGEAAWTVKPRVLIEDVTGDAVPEVVVAVLLSSTEFDFTDGYLWVFTCS
ncbi:MAG: hypothetical protein GTO14_04870, partial [Anaerolineales bacterium]|nr:hypothetical protein [Anaerolineales bacterium]